MLTARAARMATSPRDLASGIRPTFAQLGVCVATQALIFARHQHPHYEIIVCDHGDYRCLLNDAQNFLTLNPLMAIFPGLMIFIAVLSINFVGDGLRDALDPRRAP